MLSATVPRVNANDDEVRIVEIRFKNGASVSKGDIIAVVETDKAALEVTSEHAGFIRYNYKIGDVAPVQSVLATFSDEKIGDAPVSSSAANDDARITKKARKLLEENGLEASQISASGMITEKAVLGYLQQGNSNTATPALPRAALTAIENMRRSRQSAVECHMMAHCPSLKELNIQPGMFMDAVLNALAVAVKQSTALLTGLDDKNAVFQHPECLGYIFENEGSLYVQSIPLEKCTSVADIAKFRMQKSMDALRAGLKFSNEPAPVIVSLINSVSIDFHVPVLFPRTNLMLGVAIAPENTEKPLHISFVYDHRHIYGNVVARIADDVITALKAPPPA